MKERARVLVVDDSAFARKVLRDVLGADARIEVIGFARDGFDALEKIATMQPDVITLDLVMPGLDGIGVLEALRHQQNPPRAVLVTTTDISSALGVEALAAGAFDIVHKPTSLATERLYELRDELVAKVLAGAAADTGTLRLPCARRSTIEAPVIARSTDIVVIGASTGGPRAITVLLRTLPADLPVPIAVVLHMPSGYTETFARRLDGDSEFHISEARDGAVLAPGSVTIARAGMHMRVARVGDKARVVLDENPGSTLHRPSVDELFISAAAGFGRRVLGVVLTGMGNDGLTGARAIVNAKGRVLVEAASSCVVHGMPRVVLEAGLAEAEFPIEDMARAIVEHL